MLLSVGWFDYRSFDADSYQYYEKVEHGDMHWIVPGKFLAFAGPAGDGGEGEGYPMCTPDHYVPIFKKMGIKLVIRDGVRAYVKIK